MYYRIKIVDDYEWAVIIRSILQGNNVSEAMKLIADSGMRIVPRDNLDEVARLVVQLSEIVNLARRTGVEVKFDIIIMIK